MIANLITLADFADYVPFSVNISAALVDPHIRDAQAFDVWPLLPTPLRTELPTDRSSWQPATEALFTEHLRPLLVLEAARRMLLWHGVHVTPNGAEVIITGSNQPISGQQRTELRADLASKANQYRPGLIAALRAAYPSAGSIGCGSSGRRPGRGGLTTSAI